ncbi:MAG TPA: M67 family metallopeptidase [Anaerolineales bacterium]|nr:M67 family metallopeptidase [Anaerolineales bacterium]
MTLLLSGDLARAIRRHGESTYPEEGAGLILGKVEGDRRRALQLRTAANRSPAEVRRRRYFVDPREMMQAEAEADDQGLEILGVFHSHPDHPASPSETDREWALPWYVYVITSVRAGRAEESTGWRLAEDRSEFVPVMIEIGA